MKATLFFLLLAILGLTLGAGNFVYPYITLRDHLLVWTIVLCLPINAALIAVSRRAFFPRLPPASYILLIMVVAVYSVQAASKALWPNAADEYGYLFLADTLLHCRLWNVAPPVEKIFNVAWICVRNGKWFSQYPPAWPALLAPFLACHVPWLINPLLTGALAYLTWRALSLLQVEAVTSLSLTIMLALSPFVLFNGASFFPHVMMADLVMGVVVLHLRDRALPSATLKMTIGAVFGVMLLTRYEGFLLAAACFGAGGLHEKRRELASDVALMGAGALPFGVLFAAYNAAITGNPFKTPYAWGSSGAKMGLRVSEFGFLGACGHTLMQSAHWAVELMIYAGPLLSLAAFAAIFTKIRMRKLMWFDLLLPASMVFFLFYPNSGGHEFGPRYWFSAWPTTILTIGTALSRPGGWLQIGKLRLQTATLAAAHIPLFLGTTAALAVFNNAYVSQRKAVYADVPPALPALLLIPSRSIMVSSWQRGPIEAWANDFARNGVDLTSPLLYAMADQHFLHATEFTALACSMQGRHIYRWTGPHDLVPVMCK